MISKVLQILGLQASNFKSFSWSLEFFFLTVCWNKFWKQNTISWCFYFIPLIAILLALVASCNSVTRSKFSIFDDIQSSFLVVCFKSVCVSVFLDVLICPLLWFERSSKLCVQVTYFLIPCMFLFSGLYFFAYVFVFLISSQYSLKFFHLKNEI